MIKYKVTLTPEEREYLQTLSSTGSHKSQKVLHALILLNVDSFLPIESGATNATVSKILNISMKKIDRVKKRFAESGPETALCGHPKEREYDRKVDGDLEAHIVALSCSEPPEGFSRRSLRMLADRVVELEYVESVVSMANYRNQNPDKEKMLVERKHLPTIRVPSGTKYAKDIA